jgi:hypothetical protein
MEYPSKMDGGSDFKITTPVPLISYIIIPLTMPPESSIKPPVLPVLS